MEPSFLRERAARHPICTRTSRGKLVFMLLGTVISRWGFLSAALLKISVVGFCCDIPLILLLVTCQAGPSAHTLCVLIIYTLRIHRCHFFTERVEFQKKFHYLNNNPQLVFRTWSDCGLKYKHKLSYTCIYN